MFCCTYFKKEEIECRWWHMFLMTVTVLLSHCENLLYFQPLESQPGCLKVGKSPSPEDWGGSVYSLRGSTGCCQWCVPALRAHLGHTQLWLRPESDNSTSNWGLLFWFRRNCIQQIRETPSGVPQKDCRGMDVWNGRKLTWTCRYCSPPFDTGCMWTAATTHICTAVTPEIPSTEWCCQPFVSLYLHLEYSSSSVSYGMYLEQGWPLDHASASSVIYLCVLMWCSLALNFWFCTFHFLSILCLNCIYIFYLKF